MFVAGPPPPRLPFVPPQLFETQIVTVQQSLEKRVHEHFSHLQLAEDVLSRRLDTLEKDVASEMDKVERNVEGLATSFSKELAILRSAVEAEKVQRMEKEAQLMKKITDEIGRLQQRVDSERAGYESSIGLLKEEVDKYNAQREKKEETFQLRMLEEIEAMKNAMRLENEAREASEEQFATALHDMVANVHTGLQLVSRK